MNPRKIVPPLVLALATCGAGSSARHDADVLVAFGAGVAGTWETEFEFANLEDTTEIGALADERTMRMAAPQKLHSGGPIA